MHSITIKLRMPFSRSKEIGARRYVIEVER